jgi:phosphoenolpyruvate carboxylase
MATTASDVLVVELVQGECRVRKPIRFVSMFEKLGNVDAALAILFSSSWYRNRIDGEKELMIGYFSDSGKDASRFSAAWQLYKAQEDIRKVAENFGIKLTMLHGRGVTVGKGGCPTHLVILMLPETIRGSSLQVIVQGEVTEQSFGEEHLCFRTLKTFTVAASLDHRKHPPKPEWRELMDEMALVGPNKEYSALAAADQYFSSSWYRNRIDGKKELMIGYFSDSGKDASRFSAAWQLYKDQGDLRKVAENFGIKLTILHGRGVTVGRGGSPTHLVILMCPETIRGSRDNVSRGEVTEQSFGEEHLCFRTLRTFTVAASLDHRKHPPKPEWRELMDEMALVGLVLIRSTGIL